MQLIRLPLFLCCFLLVGCATHQLPQPLPKNEAIGVSSQMNAAPNISYIGTTILNNKPMGEDKQFGLNVNQLMSSYLYHQLQSMGYSSVHRISQPLISTSKSSDGEVVNIKWPSTKDIQKVMQSQHINTLVVIMPGPTQFLPDGFEAMYNPYGYGVFKHGLLMIKAAFVYGSYQINVYQAPDAKLVASKGQLLQEKIKITPWNDNTTSLTAAERNDLTSFVQQKLLPAMQQDSLAVLDLS